MILWHKNQICQFLGAEILSDLIKHYQKRGDVLHGVGLLKWTSRQVKGVYLQLLKGIISAELWDSILSVDRHWGISFVDARCAGRRNIDAKWPEFWTPTSVLETDLLTLHEQHLSSKATTHHFKITYFRKTSLHKCICFDFFWRAQVDFFSSFRLQDFGHRSLPIFCSTSPVTATSYIPSPGSAGWSWNALGRTEKDVRIEILGSPKKFLGSFSSLHFFCWKKITQMTWDIFTDLPKPFNASLLQFRPWH